MTDGLSLRRLAWMVADLGCPLVANKKYSTYKVKNIYI
jgi:hypothetical protein